MLFSLPSYFLCSRVNIIIQANNEINKSNPLLNVLCIMNNYIGKGASIRKRLFKTVMQRRLDINPRLCLLLRIPSEVSLEHHQERARSWRISLRMKHVHR